MALDVNGALLATNERREREMADEAAREKRLVGEREYLDQQVDALAADALAALREYEVPHNAPGGWKLSSGILAYVSEQGDYERSYNTDEGMHVDHETGHIVGWHTYREMDGGSTTDDVDWTHGVTAAIVRLIEAKR